MCLWLGDSGWVETGIGSKDNVFSRFFGSLSAVEHALFELHLCCANLFKFYIKYGKKIMHSVNTVLKL